jgi:hypothetical protein
MTEHSEKNSSLDSYVPIEILIIVLNFNLPIVAYHGYHQGTIAGTRSDS